MKELGSHPYLLALQRGLILVMPLIMVGALALMLRDIPEYGFAAGWGDTLRRAWVSVCDNLMAGSFGIASLAVVCSCSGTLAVLHNQRHREQHTSPILVAVVAMSCFFVLAAPSEPADWRKLFSLDRGMLMALCVAWSGSWLFLFISRRDKLRIQMNAISEDPFTSDVLALIPAGVITIATFSLARAALDFSGLLVNQGYSCRLLGYLQNTTHDTLGFALFYEGLCQLFWFFGGHGPNILFAVEEAVLTPAGFGNLNAAALGAPPPYLLTKPFINAFVRMGGSGCTLALILAILLKSRDSKSRKLCYLALLPALCNVNEPLLFGIPIVLNPVYFIPFLLTPLVQTASAYAATALELVPRTIANPVWTTPAILSGFQATGSIAGSFIQVFNLALGTAIYLPFVLISDRQREKQGRRVLDGLMRASESCWAGPNGRKCLDLPGEEGRTAKALANDLLRALNGQEELHLAYQPQIDVGGGRVHGVEALLRWKHPVYGMIPPPIAVALAEDIGCIGRLGLFVLAEACKVRSSWAGSVPETLTVSVNVSPRQLLDPRFDSNVMGILADSSMAPGQLVLEITETSVLEPKLTTIGMLRRLREEGVGVAIDDFGMGHASLRYLREFPVDTIKIDRSLTLAGHGKVHEDILRSIFELSATLGITPVLEGVETKDQLVRFMSFGCRFFQGYLFSRPVSAEDCLAFILEQRHARWNLLAD